MKGTNLGILLVYFPTVFLMLGDPDAAKKTADDVFKRSSELSNRRGQWYYKPLELMRGQMKPSDLVNAAGPSRLQQCEAHFYCAMYYLGQRDVASAQKLFELAAKTRAYFYLDCFWSQAFLGGMKYNRPLPAYAAAVVGLVSTPGGAGPCPALGTMYPEWPYWIPLKK